MGNSIKEIVAGRKTFFITPDKSLFPENFLEEYFLLNYECYFIEYDKQTSLERKIEIIISLFHDVIIFFNIDYPAPNITWPVFIKKIADQYQKQAAIGVMYTKRQSKDEKQRLEYKYLYEIGLQCGCVQLEYKKKQNFEIIEKILFANQAQGRRKAVRGICTPSCTFSLSYNGMPYNGVLQDISLSHFSFVFPEGKLNVQLYEKIQDFHFNLRGFMFRSDAVLIMQRRGEAGVLFVFGFVSSNGSNGLDERVRQLICPNIHKLMQENCNNLINQVYNKTDLGSDGIEELPDVREF